MSADVGEQETTTVRPAVRRSTRTRVVAAVALVAVVGAVAYWRLAGQDLVVPYDDPQSAGSLTLCSADGEAVTEGRVDDTPFAGVVLGETALPGELDPAGAVATLFAYQPREGVDPREFSGSPLTAAHVLADPDRPAVGVTEDVWSVADFVSAFPATYDGYVQLRLYLGTPEAGTLQEDPYDTADLRVDGDRWELVRGGDASCADADPALVP
ncbi:hypothetical protein [Nocardioides sp. 503]|uniref:hypothetical protein n=1 Tax=Nocardioides sp. 503 TaxID=2508326 RepID=UPI00106FE8BF|nr:hypothetical protein [Nocardioides sp. 503]